MRSRTTRARALAKRRLLCVLMASMFVLAAPQTALARSVEKKDSEVTHSGRPPDKADPSSAKAGGGSGGGKDGSKSGSADEAKGRATEEERDESQGKSLEARGRAGDRGVASRKDADASRKQGKTDKTGREDEHGDRAGT
ncbi:MAG: hypothetical protein IBX62_00050 [Coriobacteriia bacterium]|nr:hypothetical protein [Coriobacteriia bacterium]